MPYKSYKGCAAGPKQIILALNKNNITVKQSLEILQTIFQEKNFNSRVTLFFINTKLTFLKKIFFYKFQYVRETLTKELKKSAFNEIVIKNDRRKLKKVSNVVLQLIKVCFYNIY